MVEKRSVVNVKMTKIQYALLYCNRSVYPKKTLNPFGISNGNWLRNGNTKIRSFLDVAISATLGYFRYVKFALKNFDASINFSG